jgi:hypothetical protein
MRKILALLVLAFLAYAAWPTWSAWQLRAAVKAADSAEIERRVDWPALRTNLKRNVGSYLGGEDRSTGALTEILKRTVGSVAGSVIDAAVTPETLRQLLAGQAMVRRTLPAPKSREGADDDASDPLSPRRLRWAFFDSPTRFRVEMANPNDPGGRVISIFELQGATWKLVDVAYRAPA